MRELKESKIFIPLLSEDFRDSDWAPQEVEPRNLGRICLHQRILAKIHLAQ